jgi:hypothetical protein
MAYLNELQWQRNLPRFSSLEQTVLTVLSDERYVWRAKDRLANVTGMDVTTLEQTLADLLSKGVIKPSISKKKNLIFALSERLDQTKTMSKA